METNKNINLFGLDIEFLDYNKTILVDSIRSVMEVQSEEEENRLPIRYEEIFRNGYIENGMSSELI